MPRMRIVKPELWSDEVTGAWNGEVLSLFCSILTLCDDHGRFEASTNRIRGYAYCQRPDISRETIEEWLQKMVVDDRVVFYTSGGQRYGVVLRFYTHQRPAERFKARCPMPPPDIVMRVLELNGKLVPDGEYVEGRDYRGCDTPVTPILSANSTGLGSGSGSGVGKEKESRSGAAPLKPQPVSTQGGMKTAAEVAEPIIREIQSRLPRRA